MFNAHGSTLAGIAPPFYLLSDNMPGGLKGFFTTLGLWMHGHFHGAWWVTPLLVFILFCALYWYFSTVSKNFGDIEGPLRTVIQYSIIGVGTVALIFLGIALGVTGPVSAQEVTTQRTVDIVSVAESDISGQPSLDIMARADDGSVYEVTSFYFSGFNMSSKKVYDDSPDHQKFVETSRFIKYQTKGGAALRYPMSLVTEYHVSKESAVIISRFVH